MPIVRTWPITLFPIRTSSSRSAPFSEAAPTALMTKKLPATPRRPTVQVESLTATSSLTSRVSIFRPSASQSSRPISKAALSPV